MRLPETIAGARRRSGYRADVGSVGWRKLDHLIDRWAGGAGKQCRLLVECKRFLNRKTQHHDVRWGFDANGGG